MKSKATIKGHPLHPILVSFPIAFFTGTLLFDLLGVFTENDHFFITALYLQIAGIIGAVLAAIPGIIDYFSVVPPASSAKKRAARHGLLNTSVLIINIIALIYRHREADTHNTVLIMEIAGLVLLGVAGWMGGTLVYNNQIAVVNRYADSGKWKESVVTGSGLIEVGKADELKTDQMKLIHVGDKRIVLGKTAEGYVAFDDHCTHKGGSLAGGTMICGTVQCPWHGSQFNVRTGDVAAGPATEKINTYETREENGRVFLVFPTV